MRVLYLTDSLSDLDGVGRYAMRLVSSLQEADPDLEVEFLLSRKHRPTSDAVPKDWEVGVALPPDYFFYMTPLRYWASFFQALPKVVKAARSADIVHAIKDYPHNWLALCAARIAGKPCVATAHGTYTIQPLLDKRHRRRARATYARFASMISVSRYTRRRLLETLDGLPPAPDRITVVPNAVNAAHYREPREVGQQPWHGKRFTLGIGELKERKGHHLAVAAWSRVAREQRDLHHFIVGRKMGDAYEAAIRKSAEDAGAGDRLHFLGNISEDEKIDLLQRAEVFLHTPVTAEDGGFEGFGIVYLEASASGTPAIGSLDCGAEDAIVDGVTGTLVDQKIPAIETSLRQLLGDSALRARMGQAGREHAARSVWADNASAVRAIYDAALR
ncbi:MAG: glycosyltransferase involved in cell wall biosynthesis [Planctomycetota bacterium]|jgi:glycosyltransferase involved in cell wall biosynthesis